MMRFWSLIDQMPGHPSEQIGLAGVIGLLVRIEHFFNNVNPLVNDVATWCAAIIGIVGVIRLFRRHIK